MAQSVYVIVQEDGRGHYLLDTGGVCAYSSYEVASEDIGRFLMPSRVHHVLELQVVDRPTLLGTLEQRKAWEEKHGK